MSVSHQLASGTGPSCLQPCLTYECKYRPIIKRVKLSQHQERLLDQIFLPLNLGGNQDLQVIFTSLAGNYKSLQAQKTVSHGATLGLPHRWKTPKDLEKDQSADCEANPRSKLVIFN